MLTKSYFESLGKQPWDLLASLQPPTGANDQFPSDSPNLRRIV
ncbi:MAG: hypothetical protein ABGZ53_21080 [Fuerstiella sp.]